MKSLELFYLPNCPYCRKAEKALEALCALEPAYESVPVERIDESRNPELAASRGYYYVPSLFCEGVKLFEAHPFQSYDSIKAGVKAALDTALQS